MKSFKMNSLQRLVSFMLIAVLLICIVGFAAGGWQFNPNDEPDSGEVGDSTDKTDENTDGTNQEPSDDTLPPDDITEPTDPIDPPEIIVPPVEEPKYISTMTGLEISEEQSLVAPIGFVFDPQKPLYGISNSDLAIEFPIENGSSRILSYTTNNSMLWKVGSLAPTRAFISATSNFFGGIVISYGNDDVVKYSAWDTSKIDLDLSKISDCYYVENTLYVYTSKDLVNTAINRSPVIENSNYKSAPYLFSDEGTEISGTTKANTVILPFSTANETELYYSETSGEYLYFKSGSRKIDMLNGKNLTFTNVFILFANATTYENADGTELVIDTTGGGTGYYISKGYLTEIKWSVDQNGELKFYSLNGEQLVVNRGNAYIGYYKASNSSRVTIA